MKITNRLRIIAVGTALSVPIGIYSCNKLTEQPAIVKAIEAERKSLQMQEGEFVKKLDHWVMQLDMVCSGLRDDENFDDPYVQLNFAHQELIETRVGDCGGGVVLPENLFEKTVDKAKEIARSIVPPKRPKNDFHVEPSEDQIKAFHKLIEIADKVAPSIVEDELSSKIENNLKKTTLPKELIEESKKLAPRIFKLYKKTLDELVLEKPKLIQEIEKFNEKAKIENQPLYEPKWGLSLELLKSLKSIK